MLRTATVGGAERLVLEELEHLTSLFDVRVCILGRSAGPRSSFGPSRLIGLREALLGRFDLIHTHLWLPGLIARLRRIWNPRTRWIHTVHYHDYRPLTLGRIRRWLDHHWIYPSADALICVSPAVHESLAHLPNAMLIENAMPMDPVEAPPAWERPPVVGTVAMLRKEKGLDDLVSAVAILRDRGKPVTIRIAGDGPLRTRLMHQIRSLGLEHLVELCGYVSDLGPFYGSLAVYIQPSLSEPFGLATLEALRYRRPVVGTASGHLPTLLGDGAFGLLVPADGARAPALADAIEQALENRRELSERAEAGRAFWARRLDPRTRIQSILEVYRGVRLPRPCFVAPIGTHGGGGLQRQLEVQSRALAAAGHRCLLVQRKDPRLRQEPARMRRWAHLRVLETPTLFNVPGFHRTVERIQGALFVVAATLRLVWARHRFDVIHAHQLYSPTLVGALAKTLLGKPLVVRVTASGELGELRELRRLPFPRIRRWAFGRVDRVIVLTERMRREVLDLGFTEDQVVLMPNAVELPVDANEPETTPDRPLRVLFTGRISSEKSLETLVEAAKIVATHLSPPTHETAGPGHRITVRIVGGPSPQRDATPRLLPLLEDLPQGLEIELPGEVSDPAAEYRDADVFVLPSVSEGMSNALLEAMAHGLVVVASDIPENRAVIEHNVSGLLFPQGDARALAELLFRIREDRMRGGQWTRALRRGARARAETAFSPQVVAAQLSALYHELTRPNA